MDIWLSPAGGDAGGGMEADKNNLCSYNKHLQPFANKLRKEMTKGELSPSRGGVGGGKFMEICLVGQTNERLSIPKTKAGIGFHCRLHVQRASFSYRG